MAMARTTRLMPSRSAQLTLPTGVLSVASVGREGQEAQEGQEVDQEAPERLHQLAELGTRSAVRWCWTANPA
jgi:hypothetical protein